MKLLAASGGEFNPVKIIKIGHQPGKRDLIKPLSKCSVCPYKNIFGSWRKSLEAFVVYMNSGVDQEISEFETKENNTETSPNDEIIKHKTKRNIGNRLKVRVLTRDGNTCRLCGIKVTGENIHFDHILPWSKGGETTLENIQILCAHHNLVNGNVEYNE